jgi:hypothetical protein
MQVLRPRTCCGALTSGFAAGRYPTPTGPDEQNTTGRIPYTSGVIAIDQNRVRKFTGPTFATVTVSRCSIGWAGAHRPPAPAASASREPRTEAEVSAP